MPDETPDTGPEKDEQLAKIQRIKAGLFEGDLTRMAENYDKIARLREELALRSILHLHRLCGPALEEQRKQAAAEAPPRRVPSIREIADRYLLGSSERLLTLVGTGLDPEWLAHNRAQLEAFVGHDNAVALIDELNMLVLVFAEQLDRLRADEIQTMVQLERGLVHAVLHDPPDQPEHMERLEQEIQSRYGTSHTITGLLRGRDHLFRAFFGSILQLRGRRVLDLGCGSVHSTDGSELAMRQGWYDPWLPLVLHHAGADVTGVDIHASEGELYRHLARDLTQPDALQDIPDGSMDVVHNMGFLQPEEDMRAGIGEDTTSPLLLQHHGRGELLSLNQRLLAEAERVLREGGVYMQERRCWEKRGGKLMPTTAAAYRLAHKDDPPRI